MKAMNFILFQNTDTVDIDAKSIGVSVRDVDKPVYTDTRLNDRGLHIQIRHNKDGETLDAAIKLQQLIVAAPDMLEALRTAHYQVRNRLGELQVSYGPTDSRTKECIEHLEAIREAIAKAEGRNE